MGSFSDIKQIGEGGFAKVYSATWIDGNAKYTKQDEKIRSQTYESCFKKVKWITEYFN